MLSREPPLHWRRGFSLHRRRLSEGADGETQISYDMDHADFTAEDGTEQGICWQSVQSWQQSRGRLTASWKRGAQGELPAGVVEGRLCYALEVEPFDRVRLSDGLYEVRSVQCWPSHRRLLMQQIG